MKQKQVSCLILQRERRRLDLPESVLKEEEMRAGAWREEMGLEQVEIDAMVGQHPEELDRIIIDALAPFYDASLDRRVDRVRAAWEANTRPALPRRAHDGDYRLRC